MMNEDDDDNDNIVDPQPLLNGNNYVERRVDAEIW